MTPHNATNDSPDQRGEFALIDFIRTQAAGNDFVHTGIGDDCAILNCNGERIVVTTDLIVEGVHFTGDSPLRRIGWKAAAVSFSDVAAMGLRPEAIFCAAAMPGRLSMSDAREIVQGINDACTRFGVAMAGGDTTSSRGGIVICTTVIGRAHGLQPRLRSGARLGDSILVTGELGGSIAGKHLDFIPRVDEAVAINSAFDIGAMMDISDGLAADLHHIVTESKMGAVIDAESVPVSPAARAAAAGSAKHRCNMPFPTVKTSNCSSRSARKTRGV